MADALDLGLVLEQLLALDSGCVGFGVGAVGVDDLGDGSGVGFGDGG